MTVLTILDLIASDTKRKFKEEILIKNKTNLELKKVFWATYNPTITWWIAAHPVIQVHQGTLSLSTAIDEMLSNIASRKITGYAATEFYRDILTALSKDDAIVLNRIIDRDLRCGVGTPTINKIWKDLIPTYELMLASSDVKRLQFPDVVVQIKFDGARCLITHQENGEIEMRTRNGSLITCLGNLHDDFRKAINLGETWDGELVCYDQNGKAMPRKISNGITNKAIRGTINEKEAQLIRFAPWDVVDKTQTLSYDQRLQGMYLSIQRGRKNGMEKIIQIQTHKVECLDDVERLFNEALAAGEEGVIAKNLNAKWESKRSFNLCKFKAEETADLIVVDWEEGSGRNEGRLGALVCETSDGKIRVNVGTGFSDEQRDYITKSAIGKVVEVLYNARITKKAGGKESLYLPRFIQFRTDKNVANSSKDLK